MHATEVSVENFKALKQLRMPLSKLGCLIGKNNSGKSSVLQALMLFFSGSRLNPESDYYDVSGSVRISVTFEEIAESDLTKLVEQHRSRISEILEDGRLELVRTYGSDGKSSLNYRTMVPADERFSDEKVSDLLKAQRPGQAFLTKVLETFPELEGQIDSTMNQSSMRDSIAGIASDIPLEDKVEAHKALPTGLDRSVDSMLPTPIYVAAVKDLRDDIKTTESTPLGKILSILLPVVESQLPDAQSLFDQLNQSLNPVIQPDGTISDDRIEDLKHVESTVERFVRESFADVSLRIEIPPPELKSIFSATRIHADDGVEGLIDTKGDGLRRAVVFSILRAYVELNGIPPGVGPEEESATASQGQAIESNYLLLFEEPELYLHPEAQKILFEALRVFAGHHQVLVTTHSPSFFGPDATETFIKLSKDQDLSSGCSKPFTIVHSVDLREISARDQFQIISYESNNAAFFAESVVLVEGPSDDLVFRHVAKTINPEWDATQRSIAFVRIAGKGNVRKYREFFEQFSVPVSVLVDLDVLIEGFQLITQDPVILQARNELLSKVDEHVQGGDASPTSGRAVRKLHASGELRSIWSEATSLNEQFQASEIGFDAVAEKVGEFFSWESNDERLRVLKESTDGELQRAKWQLLEQLRADRTCVLEKGAIEDYYPESIGPGDKPSRAMQFCELVTEAGAALSLCDKQEFTRDGESIQELEFNLLFDTIFTRKTT